MKKAVFLAGIATYIALAVLSLLFYLERTAFIDISYHLFYILKEGGFAIQNNRFGAALTQAFPLLGSMLGFSLEQLMKLYSVGFVLLYFLVFALSILISKSFRFGFAMLLMSTLMVTDTFYWIQSELPQGLALLILFFSFLYRINNLETKPPLWVYPLMTVLLVTIAFMHPLLVFPFTFLILFFYLGKNVRENLLKGSFLLFFTALVLKALFFRTIYDTSSMSGLKNFFTLFPDYFSINSNLEFLSLCISNYYLLAVSFLFLTAYYISIKNWKKLILFGGFFLSYLFLINVSYASGSDPFYMENMYLPLAIFVIFPLLWDLPLEKYKLSSIILLALILTLRVTHIGLHHKKYSERVQYLESYLEKTDTADQKKMLLNAERFPEDTLFMTWASPYEFWLLSTVSEGETRSITIVDTPKNLHWTYYYNRSFVTEWGVFDYSEFPEKYFVFKDTSRYYYDE